MFHAKIQRSEKAPRLSNEIYHSSLRFCAPLGLCVKLYGNSVLTTPFVAMNGR
jgi:hypothetical protein